MGQYLSPGVFVEEVQLGARPIEGVSTSTAGVVGVTERGPENVAVLVTSFPEFNRTFGGYLDPLANPDVWYLPHAVEGFFQNAGQLLYVVRVAAGGATPAAVTLMDQGIPTGYASVLVVRAQQGDSYLVVEDGTGLAGGDWLRVDGGSGTEYVELAAPPNDAFPPLVGRVLTLRAAAYASYASKTPVTPLSAAASGATGTFSTTLAFDAGAGASSIQLTGPPPVGNTPLQPGDVLRITGAAPYHAEYAIVRLVQGTTVTLRHRLASSHSHLAAVDRMDEGTADTPTHLSQALSQGTSILVVEPTNIKAPTIVRIGGPPASDPSASYYEVARLRAVTLASTALGGHRGGEVVTELSFADEPGGYTHTLTAPGLVGDTQITLDDTAKVTIGDWIHVDPAGSHPEYAAVVAVPTGSANVVTLRQPLRFPHPTVPTAPTVVLQAVTPGHETTLLQDAAASGRVLLLSDDDPKFAAGAMVTVGPPGGVAEYGALAAVLAPSLLALDSTSSFAGGHAADASVALRAPLFTIQALDRGGWGDGLRVSAADEDPALVQTTSPGAVSNSPVPLASTSGVEPGTLLEIIDATGQLDKAAAAGDQSLSFAVTPPFLPGDVLRVGRAVPEFVTVDLVTGASPSTSAKLSLTQPLQRPHPARDLVDRMDADGLPRMGKVAHRLGANQVVFDSGGLTFTVTDGSTVRSREFRLTIEWVKAGPAGRSRVVSSETFRNLSLDDRHSRYVGTVIGGVNSPKRLWDRRPEGASDLIRVDDPMTSDQKETTFRLGPDLIFETLPSGRVQTVPRSLSGGGDRNWAVTDSDYVGTDDIDPVLRTGLFCLKNQEDISLVAVPGRVGESVQSALIDHCELMRYRVAVLDSKPGDLSDPAGASIPDVQAQRQQFDTMRAALYYPWLRLDNPFAGSPLQPPQISIPPSAHMMGICARTDVARGVFKAPANEVIAGIVGLQRVLTTGEQDVLNPSPMNVNVLRDFRLQERGLRVWGARVLTSDEAWKYLNIRRLFNFVERSLELGTQWVVFEPNDEHLWARVTRTIEDFLTSVWRSGGLVGTKPEEAFFVKCDAATNPPAERENGRLNILVGIVPAYPAEFVILRIGQWQGGSSVVEG